MSNQTSLPESDQPQVTNLTQASAEMVKAELVRMRQSAAQSIEAEEVELHMSAASDVKASRLRKFGITTSRI